MSNAGGGASGKYGKAALSTDLARRGELSKVDNSFNQQAAALPLTAAQLMQQFLGMDFGETTQGASTGTTAATGTTATTGTGTSTTATSGESTTDREVEEKNKTKSGGFSIGL